MNYQSDNISKFAEAFLAAQTQMGNATKDAKNPFFKSRYADLNSIREATIPVLNKNGIFVSQPTVVHEGKNYVKTLLMHSSGEYMCSLTEIKNLKENDPQAEGSGISYARRYGLQSITGIGAEDDDGNLSSGKVVTQTAAPTTEAPKVVKSSFKSAVTAMPAKTETKDTTDGWN